MQCTIPVIFYFFAAICFHMIPRKFLFENSLRSCFYHKCQGSNWTNADSVQIQDPCEGCLSTCKIVLTADLNVLNLTCVKNFRELWLRLCAVMTSPVFILKQTSTVRTNIYSKNKHLQYEQTSTVRTNIYSKNKHLQ